MNREDRANIAHALDHLNANHIDDQTECPAWYMGNREQFIKRHKKAKAYLKSLLEAKP